MIEKVKGNGKPQILRQAGPEKIGGCICPCDCNSPSCHGDLHVEIIATAGGAASWFWGI